MVTVAASRLRHGEDDERILEAVRLPPDSALVATEIKRSSQAQTACLCGRDGLENVVFREDSNRHAVGADPAGIGRRLEVVGGRHQYATALEDAAHLPKVIGQVHAVLDDAQAGDGIEEA